MIHPRIKPKFAPTILPVPPRAWATGRSPVKMHAIGIIDWIEKEKGYIYSKEVTWLRAFTNQITLSPKKLFSADQSASLSVRSL